MTTHITRTTSYRQTKTARLTRNRLKAVLTAVFAVTAAAQVNCVTVTTFNDEAATVAAAAVAQTYYDGLGRLTHSVTRGFGGDGEDVWQRTDYDRRGNVFRRWCRTPLTAGVELPTAQMFERAAEAFYGEGQYPYTRTMYEENTNNRPSYVYGPGEAWQRHPEQYDYGTNDSVGQYAVRMLMLNGSHLVCRGMYRRGTLRRVTHTDADGVSVTTFTDRRGHKICERRTTPGTDASTARISAETRYVYDIRGDLRYVISPQGMALIANTAETEGENGTENDENAFAEAEVLYSDYYEYDIWHRITSYRPAGCQSVEYVYDRLERCVMWRDGALRDAGRWHVVKYDGSMRRAVEGYVSCPLSREALQTQYGDSLFVERHVPDYNTAETTLQYTAVSGPAGFEAEQAWYYDSYDFTAGHTIYATAPTLETLCVGTRQLRANTGTLNTGTAQKYENNGDTWYTVIRYDDYARPAWICRYDLFGQNTRRTTRIAYDFRGREVTRAERMEMVMENVVNEGHTAVTTYAYDRFGRQKSVTLSIDGGEPQTMATYSYDAIGRLGEKTYNGTSDIPSTTYAYDVRSNITGISGAGFTQTMYYGAMPTALAAADLPVSYVSLCATEETQYRDGGDIAQNAIWAYRYDGFGRLAQASTADASMGEAFEYDLNSNILHLERRYGGDAVQDAAMTYYGNRIASVNDASLPYFSDIVPSFAAGTYTQQYDEDGRLTADGTRQITRITYTDNGVQMPQSIDFANGSRIINTYLPDGTLLRRDLRTIRTRTVVRVNAQGDTIIRTIREPVIDVTRYRGDWEINGSRWRLNTPEGIALIGSAANDAGIGAGASAGTTFSHLWYVRDRLGSVRSVVDATGTILQNTAYYASGVPVQCFDTRRVTDRGHIGNRYLDFAAIGWYDNTARMHDALLCRFTTRDPLAPDYPSLSPYAHCAANPISYVDPTGLYFTGRAEKLIGEFNQEIERQMGNNCAKAAKHVLNYFNSDKDKELEKAFKSIEKANKYVEIRTEIDVLRNSDTYYDIVVQRNMEPDVKGSFGVFHDKDNNAYLFISRVDNKADYGWIAHELKHAYQFETGKLSYDLQQTNESFYDQTDEAEAYERGRLFGSIMPVFIYGSDPYKNLSNKAEQVDPNKTVQEYQAIANKRRITFKVNGKIYTPK